MATVASSAITSDSIIAADIYRTQQQISASIQERLRRRDPSLDLAPGSTLRKVVDSIAGMISDTTLDAHISTVNYEIDQMSGEQLDGFTSLF